MKDPRDIIVAPVVSEKSYALIEANVYTFVVDKRASKPEIHDAVEAIWGVRLQGQHPQPEGQDAAHPPLQPRGPSSRHQAGHRHRRRRRPHRAVRELRDETSIRTRKPTSAGRRFQSVSDFAEITKSTPEKSSARRRARAPAAATPRAARPRVTAAAATSASTAWSTSSRTKDGVAAKVAAVEYDPNRTCRIALLHYEDGEKAYILAPRNVKVGDRLMSGQGADIRPGNALPLRYIPVGTMVHNVELQPGQRRQDGPLGRHRACSSWPRRATTPPCACPARRCAGCPSTAGRRSARSATRARAHQDRQGRPQPVEGRSPADPRRGHEPRRPSSRRWRGQDLGWPPPGVALRQARRVAPATRRSRHSS